MNDDKCIQLAGEAYLITWEEYLSRLSKEWDPELGEWNITLKDADYTDNSN